jgi:hypothetical protein
MYTNQFEPSITEKPEQIIHDVSAPYSSQRKADQNTGKKNQDHQNEECVGIETIEQMKGKK